MKLSSSLLTFMAVLASVSASDVVQLTGEAFDKFVKDNAVVMAEFYAPWCGHCQALAPEYEEAATELKKNGIPIAKVDCTVEEALCADQKIQGFPTIKVFHGDVDKVSTYPGARKADAIVSYMNRQALPAVSTVDAKSIEKFTSSDPVVVVGFFSEKTHNQTFTGLAESLRDKYIFGASSDSKLAAKYGVKDSGVVVFKNFEDAAAQDEPYATFLPSEDIKFDEDSIKKFITVESFPTFGEVGPATFTDYATSDIPLFYVFADNDQDREDIKGYLKPLLSKLKGKVNIGFIDANQYGGHAGNVNLVESWPAVAIQDFKNNHKYVHSQDDEITKKSLQKYVDAYLAGDLEPSIKSEDVPETQPEGVTKVVGKSYNDIVLDDEKDVLIEFYAPWCGHCKNLAPTYEELGSLIKGDSNLSSQVVVAKLDHTVNEVPDEIRGYPTIKLYPAGKKSEPIDYSGPRTFEGLAKFIQEKGTHQVDILAVKAAAAAGSADKDAAASDKSTEKADKAADKIDHDDL
ncbi:protein disulfide isomerase PDI1 [Sugiyamaella lignohabitans]|uniref:Protein disulfide-isomerase n=1 Tax=Sugiyamaella lignohabitans TaxID=796027 RepID=A0A167FDN5_9ASCO|nr:protein disulfide isomerase PDI1 [Sugiyamaella lignohabitans]ANB15166.1 protein disulfide isomerase PDI1 [Sugiyamaella lignohabitans]